MGGGGGEMSVLLTSRLPVITVTSYRLKNIMVALELDLFRGGGTLGISGWGCAAGTLEPLTYTRASSAEFCYPILE